MELDDKTIKAVDSAFAEIISTLLCKDAYIDAFIFKRQAVKSSHYRPRVYISFPFNPDLASNIVKLTVGCGRGASEMLGIAEAILNKNGLSYGPAKDLKLINKFRLGAFSVLVWMGDTRVNFSISRFPKISRVVYGLICKWLGLHKSDVFVDYDACMMESRYLINSCISPDTLPSSINGSAYAVINYDVLSLVDIKYALTMWLNAYYLGVVSADSAAALGIRTLYKLHNRGESFESAEYIEGLKDIPKSSGDAKLNLVDLTLKSAFDKHHLTWGQFSIGKGSRGARTAIVMEPVGK